MSFDQEGDVPLKPQDEDYTEFSRQKRDWTELPEEDPAAEMSGRRPLMFFAVGLFSTFLWIVPFCFIADYPQNFFPRQNTSLCACEKCVAEFKTDFTEFYNKTPEPFFSPDSNISESIFKYWSHLQPGRPTFDSFKETVEKVFEMFPPGPKMTGPSPDRCRTCAVVGNSGNLNNSFYGPLIDNHDIIIRMNKAPTKGYERDVGTRTTHHVMFPYSSMILENTTRLMFFAYKTYDLKWLIRSFTPRNIEGVTQRFLTDKDLVMILNPEFIHHVHHVWLKRKGGYPSTGFLTLILSLHMCDEVDVFGFGADRDGNWDHYFEKLKNKRLRTGQHPGKFEYNILKRLHRQGKIQFFRGW